MPSRSRRLAKAGRTPAASRAFSSEVDTGSREENAAKQRLGAFPRFGETRKCSNHMPNRLFSLAR
ncbi:hypothetical protein FQV39_11840 [Bosea sp. F3-2]|nr:hypothetical protein FQV39_11840 [Bosea sp. F3-2]